MALSLSVDVADPDLDWQPVFGGVELQQRQGQRVGAGHVFVVIAFRVRLRQRTLVRPIGGSGDGGEVPGAFPVGGNNAVFAMGDPDLSLTNDPIETSVAHRRLVAGTVICRKSSPHFSRDSPRPTQTTPTRLPLPSCKRQLWVIRLRCGAWRQRSPISTTRRLRLYRDWRLWPASA